MADGAVNEATAPVGTPPPVTWADRLVRVGAVLFGTGLVATVAAVIPFFLGAENLPIWLNAVASGGLTIGFAVALVGVLAAARSRIPEESDPDLYVNNPHPPDHGAPGDGDHPGDGTGPRTDPVTRSR
ncbi:MULTISPECIES: hypothetical protein [unclassified Frankia]